MAARPSPHTALHLCQRLAHTSARRLEAAIYTTQNALETNTRLSAAERRAYKDAIGAAEEMIKIFRKIENVTVPREAPKTARKLGRPTKAEVSRAEALREADKRGKRRHG